MRDYGTIKKCKIKEDLVIHGLGLDKGVLMTTITKKEELKVRILLYFANEDDAYWMEI